MTNKKFDLSDKEINEIIFMALSDNVSLIALKAYMVSIVI